MPKRVYLGTRNQLLVAGDDIEFRILVEDPTGAELDFNSQSFVKASFIVYDMNKKILEVSSDTGGIYPNFDTEELVITLPGNLTKNLYGTYDFEIKVEFLDLGVFTPVFGRITFERSFTGS